MRRQDIDVILVRLDVRVALLHLGEAFVPERHGVDDAVGLGGQGDVLLLGARANSKANFSTRSTPLRVKIASWMANSCSVPWNMRPPIWLYSPSVFSRTTQKSISPGLRLASGEGTPSNSRTGRRFTYSSKSRRIGISRPHSDT